MRFELFGSRRRGTHRPDSDFDVVVALSDGLPSIPPPVPIELLFAEGGLREWYRRRNVRSTDIWTLLGGADRVSELQAAAINALLPMLPGLTIAQLDLFLHIPISRNPGIWAVRLSWDDSQAVIELAEEQIRTVLTSQPEHPLKQMTGRAQKAATASERAAFYRALFKELSLPELPEAQELRFLPELERDRVAHCDRVGLL